MNTKLEHLPQDILKHMLSFMDDNGYLNARSVCSLWYRLSGYSWFNTVLFPQRFAPQRLHRYLNDYQKNLAATNTALDTASTWSEAQQNSVFQDYMQGIYQYQTTFTPLAFLNDVKKQLLERHPTREIEDDDYDEGNLLSRQQLLDNWQHYPLSISYLFNPVTLRHLNSIAATENNTWNATTSADIERIQNIYDATRALESLISAGIILMHAKVNDDEWNFFRNDRTTLWTGMLTGRDLLILDMRLGCLADIVEQSIKYQLPAANVPRSKYGITKDTGLVLLKKLTPQNLVKFIWNDLLHHEVILKAVQQRQPKICALLLQMSPQQLHQVCLRGSKLAIGLINHPDLLLKISDKTLITVFKECSSLNLVYLMMTPELIARLSSANFLASFNDVVLWKESNHVTREDTQRSQSVFVKYLLSTVDIVKCLSLPTIETLLRLSYLNVNEAMVSALAASDQLPHLSPSTLIALFNTCPQKDWLPFLTKESMVECLTGNNFLSALDNLSLWQKPKASYQDEHPRKNRQHFAKFFLLIPELTQRLSLVTLNTFIFSYDIPLDHDMAVNVLHFQQLPFHFFIKLYFHSHGEVLRGNKHTYNYAFNLLHHFDVTRAQGKNFDNYFTDLVLLLYLAVQSKQARLGTCRIVQEPWFIHHLSDKDIEFLKKFPGHHTHLLQQEQNQRHDEHVVNQQLKAITIPPVFPHWSLALMIVSTMSAMTCIVLAILSLAHVEAARQSMAYLQHILHIPDSYLFMDISVLITGVMINLATFWGCMIRACTYNPPRVTVAMPLHLTQEALFQPPQPVEDSNHDLDIVPFSEEIAYRQPRNPFNGVLSSYINADFFRKSSVREKSLGTEEECFFVKQEF